MSPFVIALAALLSVPASVESDPTADVAVLATGLGPAQAAAVERVRRDNERQGARVLADDELITRLLGSSEVASADERTLAERVRDAREHEARFDAQSANELRRQVMRTYERLLRPTAEMRRLTAEALHDLAASLLTEGESSEAAAVAHEAVRRFPDVPLDTRRHSPVVERLFAAASAEIATSTRRTLRIATDRPCTVYADGRRLGDGRELTAHLPAGRYRLWVECGSERSLPHPVDLTGGDVELQVDVALEARVQVGDVVALRCDACERDLAALCTRVAVRRCLLATPHVDRAPPPAVPDATVAKVVVPPAFSPWYLLPLGGGQLAQDRPIVAAGFLALEGALGIWHATTYFRHEAALRDNRDTEPSLRHERNLSASLLLGSFAVGLAEALVYGALTDR